MPDQVYNPSTSILETYIASRKDQLDRERQAGVDATNKANIESETDFRKKQAAHLAQQFEDEHSKNLAEIDARKAELDAHKAALSHAHLQSKLALIKGVHEGSIPVPQQQFQGNGTSVDSNVKYEGENGFQPPQIPGASLPQGQFQNAPITFDGTTIQGSEYNTPQQQLAQTAPTREAAITDAGKHAGVVSQATEQGKENVYAAPGGKNEQQLLLEQKKLESNERVANVKGLIAKYTADTRAQAQLQAAAMQAASRRYAADKKGSGTEVDPGAIEDRANQLRYGEGPAQGHNKTDIAALAVNSKLGFKTVAPKTVENLKTVKPLEDFSSDMTQFANKYLGDSLLSGLANTARLNAPVATEEKNDFNQLLLQSTNIAKGIEGATGRILMAQVQTAKDFIANKNITKAQLLKNAKKLNDLVLNSVEGQLGELTPAQRVDFLQHHSFSTLAAHEAAKYKLAGPSADKSNLLNHPDYEVVTK